jgi:L-ribulokinase
MAWLWKDHTGLAEAAEITALTAKVRPQYLAKCGGIVQLPIHGVV